MVLYIGSTSLRLTEENCCKLNKTALNYALWVLLYKGLLDLVFVPVEYVRQCFMTCKSIAMSSDITDQRIYHLMSGFQLTYFRRHINFLGILVTLSHIPQA